MKVTTDACILGAWSPIPMKGNFLDIGTGTGLLALMLAQRSGGVIDAIELDEESFLQAKENIKASPWKDRVHVIHADVKRFSAGKKYDFIICNPPFFENQLKSSSPQKNIARHDTSLKAADLLSAVKKILKNPEGKFAVLLPFSKSEEFISAAMRHEFFVHQKLLISDQPEREVIRCVMVFGSFPSPEIKPETLFIKDHQGNFTKQFMELLGNFYLHL
ncbi:MAG TPA: methyltransferase [Chitinophagales bacterium]|nr:methyltransferase [Chitinophagales bacterium]